MSGRHIATSFCWQKMHNENGRLMDKAFQIMAQQTSISSFSEADRYAIFECVFEYISDVRDLISLSVVSKQTRSAVYRSNGLREITFKANFVNGVNMSGENQEKLKDGLRWIWTIGKRLKTVRLIGNLHHERSCSIVTRLLESMSTTDKRPIETIHMGDGLPGELAFGLVRENHNTLRRLHVELRDQSYVDRLSRLRVLLGLSFPSLSEPSNIESFWFVVLLCDRLQFLDLRMHVLKFLPVNLIHVLHHTPLKHLGLTSPDRFVRPKILQKIVDVLSVKNLRSSLESVDLDYRIVSFLCPFVAEPACSHTPVVFVNVTALSFDFLELCCQPPYPINWLAFWAVFPAVKEIKNSVWRYPGFYVQQGSVLSQSLSNFCKTYLEVCASRSCHIKIEKGLAYDDEDEERMSAIANAFTFPEDQEWCTSHNVQIETETRDEIIETVTLRKDTATLVFHFKFMED